MKNTFLLRGAAIGALACSAPALAQDRSQVEIVPAEEFRLRGRVTVEDGSPDIIVAAAREDGVAVEEFTGSVTVIDADQIEQRQIRNIEDVLRDVPGVAVASTPGQTQIRLRGTEANHVLVLIDGIEVSDPGSGEYDLGTLQAEIGARLEVLRGPQSALYGNDALGGVVAYNTASGRDLEGFSTFAEGGTNATFNAAARAGFPGNGYDAAISAIVVSTDGEPNARGGSRDIGRDSYTLSAKGSVDVSGNFTLRAVGRYVQTEGEFNGSAGGLIVDSPGTGFENESFSALIGARLDALDGAWTHDLSAQITDANRNTTAPNGFPSSTQSDRFKLSYVTAYDFGGTDHTITFAADYEVEGFNNVLTFDDRNEAENVGFVGEYRYAGDRFDISAAIRHDINDLFQDATTFRAGAGYRVTDTTRLRATVGTGVKNPTLTELFGFFDGLFIGNPDLQPEKSTSWEVGIDQTLAGGAVMISATYFNAELESEIFTIFPPPSFIATPGNRTTDSEQQGIELAIAANLGGGFSVNGAYTYLDAEEDGTTEIRRSESTASAVLNWSDPKERGGVNLAVRHNGEALDNNFGTFPATVETLDDFTIVNLNASVRLADGIEVFARAENLLDERYEQVFSFVSPGRQVIGGVRAVF